MNFEPTKYQVAGIKLLLNHIKRDYPFIIDLTPEYKLFELYGTHLYLNVKFDLEKFYKITGAYPPKNYAESPFLYELLTYNGSYLMRYVDDELIDEFGSKYNNLINRELNAFYKRLPDYMRLSQFEEWEETKFDTKTVDLKFYKNWQEEKKAVDVGIKVWIPVFDYSKYYKE